MTETVLQGEQRLFDFITGTRYEDLPETVRHQLGRVVADLLGSALAGLRTPTSQIMARYASEVLAGREATVIGLGRTCNALGAALANACTANALDIDDGFRPAKGHPGAVIIPAALAQAEALGATGAQFLTATAVGYEVGMRASVAWHGSRPTYSGSGSWGGIGAAAACSVLLGLDRQQTWNALGIAEYHAPFADIMPCVEQPTMVKDGIHWGALVGVSSAGLAARGFTGAPQLWKAPAQHQMLASLGSEWWIERLYFKFFPCCRWAQPAVAGVLALREQHGITPEAVASIRVDSFENAAHLITRHPRNTEEAQYSLPFPVACAAVRGRVTPEEVAGDGLHDPAILEMAERVEMRVDPSLEARFPGEALERVTVVLRDGRVLAIGPLAAPGDADALPSDEALSAKFFTLTTPIVGKEKARQLQAVIQHCEALDDVSQLASLLGPT